MGRVLATGPSLIVNSHWRQKQSVAYCEQPKMQAHTFGESVAYSDSQNNGDADRFANYRVMLLARPFFSPMFTIFSGFFHPRVLGLLDHFFCEVRSFSSSRLLCAKQYCYPAGRAPMKKSLPPSSAPNSTAIPPAKLQRWIPCRNLSKILPEAEKVNYTSVEPQKVLWSACLKLRGSAELKEEGMYQGFDRA